MLGEFSILGLPKKRSRIVMQRALALGVAKPPGTVHKPRILPTLVGSQLIFPAQEQWAPSS